jgi:hypothetical protein
MNGPLLRTLAVLAALLGAAIWSGSAYAQKRVALVIGNSACADPTYLGYAFYGDAQLALVRN